VGNSNSTAIVRIGPYSFNLLQGRQLFLARGWFNARLPMASMTTARFYPVNRGIRAARRRAVLVRV
jgi:hypothetical protein